MNPSKGLSLLEVILALGIAALLAGVALPALVAVADRIRIARIQADLGEAFLTSSRLAIASGAATIACPARNGGDCDGGIDWSHGWLVFADVDGDRRFGTRDTLVRRTPAISGNMRLHSTPGRHRVVFQPDGDNAGSNVTFAICAPQSGQAATLVLSNASRLRLDKASPAQAKSCANS